MLIIDPWGRSCDVLYTVICCCTFGSKNRKTHIHNLVVLDSLSCTALRILVLLAVEIGNAGFGGGFKIRLMTHCPAVVLQGLKKSPLDLSQVTPDSLFFYLCKKLSQAVAGCLPHCVVVGFGAAYVVRNNLSYCRSAQPS